MNKWARQFEWRAASSGEAAPGQRTHRQTHYFAFLSYSHKDEEQADWLHRELERFRVPASLVGKLTENGAIPRRLTPIFRDRQELAASDDLGSEIREALAHSSCMIVLCSPAAARSKWTNAEIDAFKKLHPDGCIIAAVVAGEPLASGMAGREDEECFPPALLVKYDRRGRPTAQKAEPLAADLRQGKDGRREGFLKIVAGILGVGLDDLVQREEVRRQRRLAGITAASFVGMLIAGGLAFTAIQARDAARDQRKEAEGLVAFMLGDLREKLEPIGRLDALDGVGSRVLEYYSKQDASELTDAALLQRSRALNLTAQVAYLRGDRATAKQLYRQALAGTSEAVRRDPQDPQRLFDHAQNVFWIGEIARYQGRLPEAETAYREYKRLADRMTSLEPDNLQWRMEVAYANHNLGIVFYYQRRFSEAVRQFEAALVPIESLASIDPDDARYRSDQSTTLAWLADARRANGELEKAIALRERQIGLLNQATQRDPANVALRSHLIPARQALGILLNWTQGPASGIPQFRLAISEADRLIPIEPDNTTWKGLAAQARLQLSDTLLSLRQNSEAAAEARRGCALAADILARNTGPAWRHLRTTCLKIRSRLALESEASAEALRLAEAAVTAARVERHPDQVAGRYRIAGTLRLLGDVHQRVGNSAEASRAWRTALAQLPRNVTESPSHMDEHAKLLRRLGRTDESEVLDQQLSKLGWQLDRTGG